MVLNVITLPQRAAHAKSEIDRLGITAVYWPAITEGMTINAIANSHKQIVRFAKQNNLPEVAIAEDDILFTSLNSYKYFLDNKPDDFDIYLGNYYSGIKMPDNTMYSFCGMTIYIMASRYYDKFLASPPNRNIDAVQHGNGRFVVCQPEVAKQRNGYSYHRKKVVNDDYRLEGRIFLTD